LPTWMVVEDEPDIYDVLLAMFEIWGIEGVAFVDGAEAVAWIEDVDQGRVRGELPELAILDIRLPEVNGPAVGARLRQSPVLGNIAIVLITAYHMGPEEEIAVIKEAQADLLLYKPLPSMAELRQTMNDVIAKRQKSALEAEATPEIVSTPLSAKPTNAASKPDQAQPGDSPRAGAGSQGQTSPHSRTPDH
jgi:two-component system sensor histidine kinase/response regulator